MKTNNERQFFSSEECGSAFSQNSGVKKSIQIDSGEKAFSCQVCGSVFSKNDGLKIHMRTHTGRDHFLVKYVVQNFHITPL